MSTAIQSVETAEPGSNFFGGESAQRVNISVSGTVTNFLAQDAQTPSTAGLASGTIVAAEIQPTSGTVLLSQEQNNDSSSAAKNREAKIVFDTVITQVKEDYDLVSILRSHGIDLKRGASGYLVANCPFPNHADSSPSFKVKTPGNETYCCFGCQAKGDVLDFIRDYHHLNGVSDAIHYLTGKTVRDLWLEIQKGRSTKNSAVAYEVRAKENVVAEPVKTAEEIADELANQTDVYIGLLGLLGIDPEHEEQLKRRGVSLKEALLLGYRSLPADRNQRIKICKALRQTGYELKGVPGFFRLPPRNYNKGQWCLGGDRWGFRDIKSSTGEVYKVSGLLIPTRDLDGKIRRLKIRNDAPAENVPDEIKARFPERYMAFSSTDREDGASAGAWVHIARPVYQTERPADTKTLWITEGEIKADISALYLGETVLGMPGVGQSPQLAIDNALKDGFTEICVAMDAEEKPHVKLAIAKLIKLGKENNLSVSVACWDESQGKGLDDLLVAGGAPEVFTPDNWWQRLSNEHKTYISERITGRGAVK